MRCGLSAAGVDSARWARSSALSPSYVNKYKVNSFVLYVYIQHSAFFPTYFPYIYS